MKPVFHVAMAVDWGSVYWRQTADGVIVLGGLRNRDAAAETSTREAVNPRVQAALTSFLPEAFPGFPKPAVRLRWAGIMDETADAKPIVGRRADGSNVWVVAGFGGHGLPPALGIGRAVAQAIVHDRRPAELDPFDPARFDEAPRC
jgi:glycine/D-amino acid oxidase-like deaminating enzyme